MAWTPLSKTQHSSVELKSDANFSYAREQIMAPICSFELQGAASQMPLVFVKDGNSVKVMGLMGLQSKETSLLIRREDGTRHFSCLQFLQRTHSSWQKWKIKGT